jgi:hypothetical protein
MTPFGELIIAAGGFAALLRVVLIVRPAAGNAEKIIQKQIDQTAINWRPARRT